MSQRGSLRLLILSQIALAGCAPIFGPKAQYGITFYCPGAGNMDFGDLGIRQGLESAGYPGQVATFTWTIAPLNPAVDQSFRLNAILRAKLLADLIERYQRDYPGEPVNVIGLSAGTGVAVWALEDLKDGHEVENVILLSSSLWHHYDVSKALRHVSGKIYNYYSPNDAVLAGPMKIFGTIDGVFGQDGAGAVGLDRPPELADRVVNIRWEPSFGRYGYNGGHLDSTSAPFVQAFIAQHIISSSAARMPLGETLARLPEPAPRVARLD
jgi:pimeloyl-ACP methyl ester carboxylesterase